MEGDRQLRLAGHKACALSSGQSHLGDEGQKLTLIKRARLFLERRGDVPSELGRKLCGCSVPVWVIQEQRACFACGRRSKMFVD